MLAVLVLIVALLGFGAYSMIGDVKTVKDDALAIVGSASGLKDALKSGNQSTLSATVEDIDTRSARMDELTHGFFWNVASLVPVYGGDVHSVQVLSRSLSTLSSELLVPIADDISKLPSAALFTDDGAINVGVLSAVADALTASKDAVNSVADDVAALPAAHIGVLENALSKVRPLVSTVKDGVNVASEIAPLLPQMLGADGQTRTYVVVAQNNSELRATGGFPGSTGTVTVTDGKISLGEFSGISKLNGGEGTLPAFDREKAMFGSEYTKVPQILTTNPDWSATGKHVCDLWADRMGETVDGAIALDPVFLQHLLSLTGGVVLPDGTTIDGSNAARVLLHDVYNNLPVEQQDAYFAVAAGAAAGQIMGNISSMDFSGLIETVRNDVEQGRFKIWMANEDEQEAVVKLGLDGSVSQDPAMPEIGVYINDNTWAKMSWYLSVHTEVGEPAENADGSKTYQVTTRLKNNITEALAASDAKYITGYNPEKRSTGSMINEVYLFGPAGGTISNLTVSTGEGFSTSRRLSR